MAATNWNGLLDILGLSTKMTYKLYLRIGTLKTFIHFIQSHWFEKMDEKDSPNIWYLFFGGFFGFFFCTNLAIMLSYWT